MWCNYRFLICHFDFLCFIFDIVWACPELAEGITGPRGVMKGAPLSVIARSLRRRGNLAARPEIPVSEWLWPLFVLWILTLGFVKLLRFDLSF
jgi:hypothetical protein